MTCGELWSAFGEDISNFVHAFCCCVINADYYSRCMSVLFIVSQFISLILQIVGTSTKDWIYVADCGWLGLKDSCAVNIIENNTTPVNTSTAHTNQVTSVPSLSTTFDLQIASITFNAFVILAAGTWKIRRHCTDSDDIRDNSLFCFNCLLPFLNLISGVLTFAGCMLVVSTEYPLGWSLYICLGATLGSISITLMACVGYCCIKSNRCL